MEVREILTYGNAQLQFDRLGVVATLTFYSRESVGVYEISHRDFLRLCDEPVSPFGLDPWTLSECGWQAPVGSNLGPVDKRYRINGRYLKAWNNDSNRFGNHNFKNISEYLENVVGATTTRNVAACYACLAKQNGLKISELLKRYGL